MNARTHDLLATQPRLAAAYHAGLLVPFLGAGMSWGACPMWEDLVVQLEEFSTDHNGVADKGDLVRRADRIVTRLGRDADPDAVARALRQALYKENSVTNDSTTALAQLWWPLVVTTNYDDLFVRANARAARASGIAVPDDDPPPRRVIDPLGLDSEREPHRCTVLGRSQADCQRLLIALSQPEDTVLWALHGFVPREEKKELNGLAQEAVFGHEQYRRIAHASVHYRRAFAELYRRRSLLFLGSSLSDVYLLDLFAEVQELYGPSREPHFAFVSSEDTVDAHFLRTRFNIQVIPYGKYTTLPFEIDRLVKAVRQPAARQTNWSFAIGEDPEKILHRLTISESGIPLPAKNECAVISASWDRQSPDGIFVTQSKGGTSYGMQAQFQPSAQNPVTRLDKAKNLFVFTKSLADPRSGRRAAVVPWQDEGSDSGKRDMGLIQTSALHAINWAASEPACDVLHLTMLGAGSNRHFPARFALLEIARAFASWSRNPNNCKRALELRLHVIDGRLLWELRAGHVDVSAALACHDIPFWTQVAMGAAVSAASAPYEPALYPDTARITKVLADLSLDPELVQIDITPRPMRSSAGVVLEINDPKTNDPKTLRELGVFPGSVLRITHLNH